MRRPQCAQSTPSLQRQGLSKRTLSERTAPTHPERGRRPQQQLPLRRRPREPEFLWARLKSPHRRHPTPSEQELQSAERQRQSPQSSQELRRRGLSVRTLSERTVPTIPERGRRPQQQLPLRQRPREPKLKFAVRVRRRSPHRRRATPLRQELQPARRQRQSHRRLCPLPESLCQRQSHPRQQRWGPELMRKRRRRHRLRIPKAFVQDRPLKPRQRHHRPHRSCRRPRAEVSRCQPQQAQRGPPRRQSRQTTCPRS